jgi:hypothetical protein
MPTPGSPARFAFNQGFYNLFLTAGVAIGLALGGNGRRGRRSGSRALRLRLDDRRRRRARPA